MFWPEHLQENSKKPSDKLLPPPRIYLDTLEGKTLFIPKISSSNILFPKSLSSYITSEELSLVSSPPVESVPGYEIQKMPALALTDTGNKSGMLLGSIADHGNPIRDAYLHLSKSDLNKHLFVCGLTGSGKTTTIKHILKTLVQHEDTPFLVLESAKRDYRQLLANDVFKDNLNIFTIGDATVSPIRFNPFYIQEGVHPLVHIDYLKAIFNASFSLYGPMPSIVEKCLHAIYIKRGWDLTLGIHPNFVDSKGNYEEERYRLEEHFYCFPTLTDLKNEVDHYIKEELDYKGELRDNIRTAIIVRLESLCVGAKGLMFNTHDFFSLEKLLSKNTILEMESLADDDDKAFFVGLILVLISEYRQKENPAVNPGMGDKGLRHFMVIEEAHRLLKNVETERTTEMMGNPKGKAVEVFCNILAEMRSLGQGVAVVEQIPSKISPDVIKNSNTKIVHRLVSKDDQSLLAGSLSIDDNDALYLNRLKAGHALCHKEGMGRPVECAVLNDVNSHAISDQKINSLMSSLTSKTLHSYQAYQMDALLGQAGKELAIKFFNSIITLQSGDLDKLIAIAKNEMEKLLVLKGISSRKENPFFSDYFVLQIMILLNKGIYYQQNPVPGNLKAIFTNIISNPTEELKNQLINNLSILWKPITARDFIFNVIENLAIRYLYQNNSAVCLAEIESSVSSFLLLADKDSVKYISQKIQNKVEVCSS
ncbi:MAG: ATP-binding protein [Thiothrix sp.]